MFSSRRARIASIVLMLSSIAGALPAVASEPIGRLAPSAAAVLGGRFATEEMFVDQAYRDVLGRPADTDGLVFWSDLIRRGTPPNVLLAQLVGSDEFSGVVEPVVRLYYSVFDRAPDLDGLRFWIDQRRSGSSLEQIAEAFIASNEFAALSNATSDTAIVEAVYGRVLGRDPEPAGLNYWLDLVSTGQLSVPGFVVLVSESPEHQNRRNPLVLTTTVYLGLLQRLADPGGVAYWSDQIANGLSHDVFVAAVLASQEYSNRFPAQAPSPSVRILEDGLRIPWDVAALPDGNVLVSQRNGSLRHIGRDGHSDEIQADLADLLVSGETGLMGLAIDSNFVANRRFYSCQGHTNPRDVRVIAWTLAEDDLSASRVADPLVDGIDIGSGRHGGCQLTIDASGMLVIGTGDAAIGTNPQDLGSLAGKVLRVDPTTGEAAPGNPFADSQDLNTRLILSYGHRNVQGVAIHPDTQRIWTVEHGPGRDDEVNLIIPGANYGWDPVPGYNEAVPMTDLVEFPNAVSARYSTGAPTLALSGADFLSHEAWGSWRGGLVVAALKDQTLRVMFFSPEGLPLGQRILIDGQYGRLRAVHSAPDGSLLITTSNGTDDQVLLIQP